MTTTSINDTLVQLESLYTAYDEILKQAKEQLESFDVTDSQITRVATKLEGNKEIQEAAKQAAITDFVRAVGENDLDFWRGRQFVDKIAEMVIAQVKDEVNRYVRDLLNDQDIIQMIDRRAEERITQNTQLTNAMNVQGALTVLMKHLDK